jgi:signal transduction histidine kinase
LRHWPALRTAVDNQQRIELQPNGLGARQLHQLYEEFGLSTDTLAPMIVEPLTVDGEILGLLLVAHPVGWSEDDSIIVQALATYLAQLLANGRRHHQAIKHAVEAIEITITDPPPVGTGRIIALEADNKRLQEEAQLAKDRLYQEEQRAALAQQQARHLAATIEESQRNQDHDELSGLQAEIESLRQALLQAQVDNAAGTESTMQAITRYSGELEEAQSHIKYLEMELRNRHDDGPHYDLLASLAEELRTPLTSIAGYTDLLLGGSVGNLVETQRSFLQRVRANTERLSALLEQIIQLAVIGEATPVLPDTEPLDARELVESAVHTVITRLQDKNLRLDMDIPDQLEPLAMNREALQQILTNLLNNACQSSPRNGRISINVRSETFSSLDYELPTHFIHIAISDSGDGISPADQARVFEPHLQTDGPLIEGLGDTAAGLAVARTLTQAYGGRIWVESEVGQGSTFSLIFPLGAALK